MSTLNKLFKSLLLLLALAMPLAANADLTSDIASAMSVNAGDSNAQTLAVKALVTQAINNAIAANPNNPAAAKEAIADLITAASAAVPSLAAEIVKSAIAAGGNFISAADVAEAATLGAPAFATSIYAAAEALSPKNALAIAAEVIQALTIRNENTTSSTQMTAGIIISACATTADPTACQINLAKQTSDPAATEKAVINEKSVSPN
jgi:hypothetical protein